MLKKLANMGLNEQSSVKDKALGQFKTWIRMGFK